MAYASDLSDAKGEIVEPLLLELLPKKKKLVPPNGQTDTSLMASCINSKMVVISATYPGLTPLCKHLLAQ